MNSSNLQCHGVAATDLGQRSHNEDASLCDDQRGLYIVADGVGGREAGEIAAQLACQVIADHSRDGDSLPGAISAAHHAIRRQAEDPQAAGRAGMACTAVVLRLSRQGVELAWSGDSRAYFWDGSLLRRLSRDHSLVEALIARGEIARQDAADHPQKNVILSALGGEPRSPEVGSVGAQLPRAGVFLLCSDGLSDMLTAQDLCDWLAREAPLDDICNGMVAMARERGGRDNITAVLVQVEGSSTESQPLPAEEIFDPATGEFSWPGGARPLSPSVRRLRPRNGSEATASETALVNPDGMDTDSAGPTPEVPGHRARPALIALVLLLVLLGGAALYLL